MCTALSSKVPHLSPCCPLVNVFLDVKCVTRIVCLLFCCLGVLGLEPKEPKGRLDVWQAVVSNPPCGTFVHRVQHLRGKDPG